MSYQFIPDTIYRMPTHFGPLMGPRQGPDGRTFDCVNNPKTTTLSISFLTNPDQLKALLPACYELSSEPIVTVHSSHMTEVEWLAGRGYAMLGVSFPAKFQGKVDKVEGSFLSVLWENLCDPIITGREELGFAKVYSEISEPVITGDKASVTAGWQGFDFLNIDLSNLQEETEPSKQNTKQRNDGLLHYKYIPKTGAWGKADVEYPVLSPASGSNTRLLKSFSGDGVLKWNKARWEELPTLYTIVNTLAELEVLEYTQASLAYTIGSDSLRGQRILT
jgi:hypothetical protein